MLVCICDTHIVVLALFACYTCHANTITGFLHISIITSNKTLYLDFLLSSLLFIFNESSSLSNMIGDMASADASALVLLI